jgi:glycosyltransferase involved in cell wall biosynthesis
VTAPTWDVLIPTIPHRHEKLRSLLAEFDRQWQPGFGVRVLRDNLERPGPASHAKRQDLIIASRADYVSFVDDDDLIPADYVARIMTALAEGPDYVGFQVNFTEDGARNWWVEHSLRHGRWCANGGQMLRDISHLNPIRRELALLADWNGRTDEEWAEQLRATGRVRTEVWIPAEMYTYLKSSVDGWRTERQPMPEPLPSLPAYPWLKVL